MKKIFLIFILLINLKADLILNLENQYSLYNYPYTNVFKYYKEFKIKEKETLIFKLDFKYQYLETNNVSFISEENYSKILDKPSDLEITGFYFGFNTEF